MKKNAEIELKAHVTCPEDCKEKLCFLAGKETAISKDDSYWFPAGIRIREDKTGETVHVLVTWKNKEKRDGLEVNDEHEFDLKESAEFEELLLLLGLEKKIIKHKQGWVWYYDGITAELCEVSGTARPGDHRKLGWFLELEILSDDGGAETVALARKKLLELLEKAGIGKEHMETRYYSEMLAE